jgi:hypothetical protein
MELKTWGAASCAATQELPNILWNPKVHYRVHKSPSLVLSWAKSIQSIPPHPISLRDISILSTHLRLGLPTGLFPSGILAKILYAFLFPHSCYISRPSHPPRLDHSNHAWRRIQVMKLHIMQFSPASCHFIPFRKFYKANIILILY